VFNWGSKPPEPAKAPVALSPDREVALTVSKVFPKFLWAVAQQPRPSVLDLGPVVGSNVAFFGERLACKLYIEDLFLDVEAAARRGVRDDLGATLVHRLTLGAQSVDGILCWDLFDFLDRKTGLALAAHLATLLRDGGALYGCFGTTPIDLKHYTRYVVDREDRFQLRPSPATPVKRGVLMTRDITKMFAPLAVTDSVLLKTSTRETLFRRSN
jgi:hypothetical protein